MKKICVQCKKEFELPQAEINFYEENHLHIPKRCKACRAINKSMRVEMQEESRPQAKRTRKKKPAIYSAVFVVLALALFLWDRLPSINEGNSPVTEEITYAVDYEQPNTDESVQQEQKIEKKSVEIEKAETKVDTSSTRKFRKEEYLLEHFEKHGIDMGFSTAEEYLEAANRVLRNEDVLHKKEAEDGDDVYYLEATNEFVIVSPDGYIRTYFHPEDGIEYFNRQ